MEEETWTTQASTVIQESEGMKSFHALNYVIFNLDKLRELQKINQFRCAV